MSNTVRLEARGVTMRFGGLIALSNVDISVDAGTVTGLVGPNGAGKSTLFGVLSGLLRPTEGTVLMGGEDVTKSSPQARAKRGMSRTFQHPELFTSLSVREHVMLSHRMKHTPGRAFSDLILGKGLFGRQDKVEAERVESLLAEVGLADLADQPVVGLSLGTCRLVEIARALASEPEVMLMDEPFSGLDAVETERVAATMRSVVAERGVSLLLVEHDVPLVLSMCDRVHVLDFGTKIAEGTPEEIRTNAAVQAAYLGDAIESPASGETTHDQGELV